MAEIILDASAILAVVHGEPGADVVLAVIGEGLVSAVNHAEVLTHLVDNGMTPSEAAYLTARLGYEVAAPDASTAATISAFRERTRRKGVSLGDQFCLALAMESQLPALTGERRWPELGLDVEVRLIR
jgi:ribonuclease VapC